MKALKTIFGKIFGGTTPAAAPNVAALIPVPGEAALEKYLRSGRPRKPRRGLFLPPRPPTEKTFKNRRNGNRSKRKPVGPRHAATGQPSGNSHDRRVGSRLRARLAHRCNDMLGYDADSRCNWCGKEREFDPGE